MPASFPPELCDQIIDYLWDDLDSLRACSLTCYDWHPSSRFHLFRNVRLRHSDDVTRFRALLASSPGIAPCVRKLSLSADYDGSEEDGAAREDDAWVNSAAELFLSSLVARGGCTVRGAPAASRTRWDSSGIVCLLA